MTLLEWVKVFEKAEKNTPRVRDVKKRLKVIMARILLIQITVDKYQRGETELVEFPYSELQATTKLIEDLIPIAYAWIFTISKSGSRLLIMKDPRIINSCIGTIFNS